MLFDMKMKPRQLKEFDDVSNSFKIYTIMPVYLQTSTAYPIFVEKTDKCYKIYREKSMRK